MYHSIILPPACLPLSLFSLSQRSSPSVASFPPACLGPLKSLRPWHLVRLLCRGGSARSSDLPAYCRPSLGLSMTFWRRQSETSSTTTTTTTTQQQRQPLDLQTSTSTSTSTVNSVNFTVNVNAASHASRRPEPAPAPGRQPASPSRPEAQRFSPCVQYQGPFVRKSK
ncbi:hypothetical protein H105_01796 [Trichophyton soudanense CBS 452.61]|uniref:Uncharacterized protein n=1 Tax=Trichophyton soudanense CBS 452.61 TaxID=1215331 RepID=A0A022Y303_TRISD|nr:hypothetical protein H105_01796 [Trichophyton soudanense CBS 452.61]